MISACRVRSAASGRGLCSGLNHVLKNGEVLARRNATDYKSNGKLILSVHFRLERGYQFFDT